MSDLALSETLARRRPHLSEAESSSSTAATRGPMPPRSGNDLWPMSIALSEDGEAPPGSLNRSKSLHSGSPIRQKQQCTVLVAG
eukprot:scaffold50331_cov16-Prasinocladus_malaysianus.AAC.1